MYSIAIHIHHQKKLRLKKNHKFFRYYVTSDETLNGITQEQIDLMFSDIKSYNREAYSDYT